MKNYKIWDCQLECYKEDFGSFESKEKALQFYGDCLREQMLDGNGGNELEESEINKLSNEELFKQFDYEVHSIQQ